MTTRTRLVTLLATLLASLCLAVPVARASGLGRSLVAIATRVTSNVGQDGTTASDASVGAVFQAGQSAHNCTGCVIDSPSGSLVLTAAHCVTGTGVGTTFVPGYDGGAPYGTWSVTAVYALDGWQSEGSTDDDMVLLRVAPRIVNGTSRTIESVVGGEQVGTVAAVGQTIRTLGYVAGTGTTPVTCSTTVTSTSGTPTVACAGFAGGTSGSPWLVVTADGTRTVVGIVGGLHQGGCTADISYSPAVTSELTALLEHAESATSGDTVVAAGSDGC